ncbi:MAG: PilW family protein [bacterium]
MRRMFPLRHLSVKTSERSHAARDGSPGSPAGSEEAVRRLRRAGPRSVQIRSQGGFSLTELLVTLVVSGVLVIGIAGGYVVQKRSYEGEAGLRDMQLNARLATDQVTRLIRNAGLGCRENFPPYANEPIQGSHRSASGVFTAENHSDGPDVLSVVTALGSRALIQADASDSTVLRLDMPPEEVLNEFNPPTLRYVYIAPWDENRFLRILAIAGSDVTLSAPRTVRAGDKMFRVNLYTIMVDQKDKATPHDLDGDTSSSDDRDGDGIPDLVIFDNTQDLDLADGPLAEVAEGIEDLQFQYGWDADESGVIDPAEYVDDPTGNEERIRAVRVFILARSLLPEPNHRDLGDVQDPPSYSYTLADHTIQLDTSDADGIDSDFDYRYHRHLLVETVMVRNRNL